jgi:N-acetylmuramic acid 6-phosphate etherase
MNEEDHQVAPVVKKSIPQIEKLVQAIVPHMKNGGRLFYIGAGTSGRLGVVDASECPPTFGVGHDVVVGVIAGGDGAIRKAVEFAEDDPGQAWKDLQVFGINDKDAVIGIAASGTTPYVVGGIKDAARGGLITGCITCNEGTPLASVARYPVEVIVGPEFITGSTRLKAGTAQKMVLNMISTSVMIQLGRVKGNKMTHMQLSNTKLFKRAIKMLTEALDINENDAEILLKKYKSVQQVFDGFNPEH